MPSRRRCPTCNSKQWHKEPASGLIACSEGHILQDYRPESKETEDLGPHALRKRALKAGKKRERKGRTDPKVYHGARGRYHYMLCLQLIFRMQVAALQRLWDLPPEFEVLCRDLWALHLELLPTPVPAAPYNHAQGEGKEEGEGNDDVGGKVKEKSDDEDSSGEEEDVELDELLKENSESSSTDEDEEEGVVAAKISRTQASGRLAPRDGSKGKKFRHERTLGVLVVACTMMRIPVLYEDFIRLIESYKLPYLEPVRLLPRSMVCHLTKSDIQALCPHFGPNASTIHHDAIRFARQLESYGVGTPSLNAAPAIWRLVRRVGGTPQDYLKTKGIFEKEGGGIGEDWMREVVDCIVGMEREEERKWYDNMDEYIEESQEMNLKI